MMEAAGADVSSAAARRCSSDAARRPSCRCRVHQQREVDQRLAVVGIEVERLAIAGFGVRFPARVAHEPEQIEGRRGRPVLAEMLLAGCCGFGESALVGGGGVKRQDRRRGWRRAGQVATVTSAEASRIVGRSGTAPAAAAGRRSGAPARSAGGGHDCCAGACRNAKAIGSFAESRLVLQQHASLRGADEQHAVGASSRFSAPIARSCVARSK